MVYNSPPASIASSIMTLFKGSGNGVQMKQTVHETRAEWEY